MLSSRIMTFFSVSPTRAKCNTWSHFYLWNAEADMYINKNDFLIGYSKISNIQYINVFNLWVIVAVSWYLNRSAFNSDEQIRLGFICGNVQWTHCKLWTVMWTQLNSMGDEPWKTRLTQCLTNHLGRKVLSSHKINVILRQTVPVLARKHIPHPR